MIFLNLSYWLLTLESIFEIHLKLIHESPGRALSEQQSVDTFIKC